MNAKDPLSPYRPDEAAAITMSMQRRNKGYAYRTQAGDLRSEETLTELLARKYSHSSQETWKCRLDAGEIEIDGVVACQDCVIRNGAWIVWHRPGWLEPATPQTFTVEFEDEWLLVVGKPSGLPTLPSGGYYLNTLLSIVREQYASCHPVHRLGSATSGLVLFAKSKEIASKLSQAWGHATKRYQAIVEGCLADSEYDIRQRIGKIFHPRLGTVHGARADGKTARTVVRPIQRHGKATEVEATLHTGRPHQIRIHTAAIGHPLVGDPMYSAGGGLKKDPGFPSDGGYLLHAHELEFEHPVKSGKCYVQLASPPEFSNAVVS
ncbi:MAG: RluA family pseudouridine synthase [Planctomycetota bacterium]